MEKRILEEGARLIGKEFALQTDRVTLSREGLIHFLEPEIRQLLDRDFNKLLQICYRIDLGEEKLKHILHESEPGQLARDLTEALVDRQVLKAKIKSCYK